MKVLVLYYDENTYSVKLVEDAQFADSAQAHVYGLPDNCDVIAVIANPGNEFSVYIDEELVLGEGA